MNLYEVTTTEKEYHGHRDVIIHWFISERGTPITDYESAIAGYEVMPPVTRESAEDALNELFTEDEAHKLAQFLEQDGADKVEVKQVETPIKGRTLYPWGAEAVSGRQTDFIIINSKISPLPFSVWGFYNLGDHKLIPLKRFSVSQFDSQTYVVADDLHENEFCVCGAYDEQTLPPETRAALIARFLNSFSEIVALSEQA